VLEERNICPEEKDSPDGRSVRLFVGDFEDLSGPSSSACDVLGYGMAPWYDAALRCDADLRYDAELCCDAELWRDSLLLDESSLDES